MLIESDSQGQAARLSNPGQALSLIVHSIFGVPSEDFLSLRSSEISEPWGFPFLFKTMPSTAFFWGSRSHTSISTPLTTMRCQAEIAQVSTVQRRSAARLKLRPAPHQKLTCTEFFSGIGPTVCDSRLAGRGATGRGGGGAGYNQILLLCRGSGVLTERDICDRRTLHAPCQTFWIIFLRLPSRRARLPTVLATF